MSKIVMAGEGGWAPVSFEELPQVPRQGARRASVVERSSLALGHESTRAAEREAEAILLTAREVAQQIEREAYREGRTKGQQEAMAEMRRRIEPLEAMLQETCRQVESARQTVITNAEGELIDLAIAVAERVLRSELAARPDAAVPIVRAALEAAGSRKVMAVRVNPSDYELLAEHRGELLGSLESARLISDPAIASGGCVVEVESGLIDARLESQLQEAAHLLGRDQIS
ncbi:FliH/SctL family protein [Candidatus Methylomirabilis sp.]|uniref:FliH/SctL family protein n=1 Tax=Candidatus Methylomirabilis sp. TaxID=2032687 RepID=UPI002A6770DA|nr:FliH/SctL family protein [Candidatus Methylomirabilis sp.]